MKEDDIFNTWKEESDPLSSEIQPNQFEEELKERIEYLTIGDQILNSSGGGTMKIGFSSMASPSFFSPQNSRENGFQGVTHVQIHIEVTFMSSHGEGFCLKVESTTFPYEGHFDSLVGGRENFSFDHH